MTRVQKLSSLDSMFLLAETRETMMHVAGLHTYSIPKKWGKDKLRQLVDAVREEVLVYPPWNLKLKHPHLLAHPNQGWEIDENFDLDYHLRRSALPSPGDERELGILVSRLHSNPLDFTRPPWEFHLIEGLEGNRFAIYVKIHHALIDGYTGSKMLVRSMSKDDVEEKPFFFSQPQPERDKQSGSAPIAEKTLKSLLSKVSDQWSSTKKVAGAVANLAKALREPESSLMSSFSAPVSVLNGPVGRNRRFATQQFSMSDLKAVAKAGECSLNDVVLTLCAGGLRKFLLEMGELPKKPLVAFLPVNIRPAGDEGGGNAVGAMLASLATNVADPMDRFKAILRSTRSSKSQMKGMSSGEIFAYSGLLMSPMGMQMFRAFTGLKGKFPVTCNVCISNVPGPDFHLYFHGARLEASYPVSIPTHGMALNITCFSYADTLNFGFVGCRDTLPHLQRLAVYTGETMEELKALLKISTPKATPAEKKPVSKTSEKAKAGAKTATKARTKASAKKPVKA